MLKLMYITNNPDIVEICEKAGVDRIFIDMEYIGKDVRQKGLDSVKNHHTFEDIERVKKRIKTSELLVRINPIHDKISKLSSSEEEIDKAIKCGADILMLPYFRTASEVERFVKAVNGRCKTMILLETISAVAVLDDILKIKGIDEIHIGLNDLSIDLKEKFMFEPLADGLVDEIAQKIKKAGIPFGFGGIASLGSGAVKSNRIIMEHYRLGSQFVILSRSFCNTNSQVDLKKIDRTFCRGVKKIRNFERKVQKMSERKLEDNKYATKYIIRRIINRIDRIAKNEGKTFKI